MTALAGERVDSIGVRRETSEKASWQDIVIDLTAVVALGVLGTLGFRLAYGGHDYLIAGVIGVLVGTGVGGFGAAKDLGSLAVAALLLSAYFAFSGVALHDLASAGVVPNLAVIRAAATGPIWGWAELITTLAPVGGTAKLLAVPYVAGAVMGVYTVSLARRTSSSFLLALGPVALFVGSILFGTATPAAVITQGIGITVVLVAWISVRRRGPRSSPVAAAGRSRFVGGTIMLVLAGVVGITVGSHVPGLGDRARYVLREQADPPFDPRDYASPLAGYRHYSDDRGANLRDEVLFTVSGLPKGVPIRLAVLDSYDGIVWTVGGGPGADESSGVFQRVGELIPTDADGQRVHVSFRISAFDDVWLPVAGDVTGVRFGGDRSADQADSLRFNRRSNTAAVPVRVRRGDRYVVDAVVPPDAPDEALAGAGPGAAGTGAADAVPDEVKTLAAFLTESIDPGYARARALSQSLIGDEQFGFSDGRDGDQPSAAGHSDRRMVDFAKDVTDKGLTFGNGEQYASALALMSRSVGMPARVVMGFCPEGCPGKDVEVKGDMVGAWVEVEVAGAGWVPLLATPDKDKQPKEPTPLPTPKPENASQPPPPPVTVPPSDEVDSDDLFDEDLPGEKDPVIPAAVVYTGVIAGVPLLLLGIVSGSIIAHKRRRRSRRRHAGTLRGRIAGGWSELQDLAMDLGTPFPAVSTRRESAEFVADDEVAAAARMADLATFGPNPPIDDDIDLYWAQVDRARANMVADLGRIGRARVAVSPTSVLAHRKHPVRQRGRRRARRKALAS